MTEEETLMSDLEFMMRMLTGIAVCKECPHYDDGACESIVKHRDEYIDKYDTLEEAIAAVDKDLESVDGHATTVLTEVREQIVAINNS